MTYLFLFRAYPDIDHFGPLVWKLLEEGEEVHAVITPGYDPTSDHHLGYLSRYERFHVHEAEGWWRGTFAWALSLVATRRVRVVGVEWGHGPPASSPFAPRGLVAIVRRMAASMLKARRRDPNQMRTNFVLAAWLLRRPLVSLPHGLSIKLENLIVFGEQAERFEREGQIDWTDRNRFSAYVVNTEHHRRWHLDHAGGDPEVVETWGSLRWAPEWFELNRRMAPPFGWPSEDHDRLKVVFMVPKWRNRASPEAARELLKRMQQLDFVSLAVKSHPRKEGAADPLYADPDIDWERIHDVSAVDSVPLIAASDVVIDVGSSIGIECVMQGKVLVNPTHLHGMRTLFDSIEGSCVQADSADEVAAYLRAHAAGNPHEVPEEAHAELLRRAVYGDRDEPFDVLGLYAGRIRELARAGA